MWNLLESNVDWSTQSHSVYAEAYETKEAARAAMINRYNELKEDPEFYDGDVNANDCWVHLEDTEIILEITEPEIKKVTIQDVHAEYDVTTGEVVLVADIDDMESIDMVRIEPAERPSFAHENLESDQTDYEEWYNAALSEAHLRGMLIRGEEDEIDIALGFKED